MKLVSYIRVSTRAQGESGLGLDAQLFSAKQFIEAGSHELLATFREVETGKNNDRPELARAIALCKQHKATLLIAKLDRLSRSAAFLLNLRDSGIAFICCDMPQADKFTVGILACCAERERELIASRTKDGLAAARRNGTRLGVQSHKSAQEEGYVAAHVAAMNARRAQRNEAFRQTILPLIEELRRSHVISPTEIAQCLNVRGLLTQTGKQWHASQVRNLIRQPEAELIAA